ncbi:MAG TPA: hypothetical protein PK765_03735 [bacterium]|nr:hypothetical protein [bacterium]
MATYCRIILAISVFLLGLFSPAALAQNELPEAADFDLPFQTSPDGTIDTINIFISEGIKYVGILAVLVLCYGGIMMITSYGEDGKTKTARLIITYALVGVLTASGGYFLVNIINNIRL